MNLIKMVSLKFKWLLMICLLGISSVAAAAGDSKVTKTINKSYVAGNNTNFELLNKYGQIVINNWNKDSIKIEIEVIAYAKSYSQAQKILNRVDFDFVNNVNYIKVETVLDRQSDYLTELWNKFTDYSRTMLSRNNLNVNYTIYMPANIRLNLDNKFGDVYIDMLSGKSKVFVSYGHLKANDVKNTTADIQFGSASFKNLSEARLRIKASEVNIQQVEVLDIESGGSEFSIGEAGKLKVNSRNDKFKIEQLHSVSGSGSFSRFDIGVLEGGADMQMSFGEFTVTSLQKSFESIEIQGRSTDISLRLDRSTTAELDITTRENKLFLAKDYIDNSKSYTDGREKYIMVSGKMSIREVAANASLPKITINAQNGDVKINFKALENEGRAKTDR